MNQAHLARVAGELSIAAGQVASVAALLAEGATVPFIARYRKEATASLDEVAITAIRDRLEQLEELQKRRETILKSLEDHGHLNDELQAAVEAAETLSALEDIYLPYRPKRRTRATIAREKGLEPLATAIFEQKGVDPETLAAGYRDADKGSKTWRTLWPAPATSWPNGSTRIPGPASACAPSSTARGLDQPRGHRQGNRGDQVQGLLRLVRARRPRPRPTASWPCAAGSARIFST
jgi:hypothetical protein